MQPILDDPRDDRELVACANRGDASAFEGLYRRHRDWVVNLAFRFTGDRDLALDVLQDTFLYLLKKFPGFSLTCQMRSFLYPAVRHLAIASRQKAGRLLPVDHETLAELPAPVPAADGDSARDSLSAVVAALPAAQREVLLLRFVEGFSLGEIAQALEIPLGTVKSRLHNALTALREDARTRQFLTHE